MDQFELAENKSQAGFDFERNLSIPSLGSPYFVAVASLGRCVWARGGCLWAKVDHLAMENEAAGAASIGSLVDSQ